MVILYDGIGAKRNHLHTEEEYLNIMRRSFLRRDWNHPNNAEYLHFLRECLTELNIQRQIPEEFPLFTLNDWLEFVGGTPIYN